MGYTEMRSVRETARLIFEPTRAGVLSWNTYAHAGSIAFRLLRAHTPATEWLEHVEWNESGRRSFSPQHEGVIVDTDIIRADQPFDGIEIRAPDVDFNLLAFSMPVSPRASLPFAGSAMILDVPARSQYVSAKTHDSHDQRMVDTGQGWCSPASLSMLHAYHGIDIPVAETATRVFDRAYNGTGNWSFNVSASGHLGFHAVVAYLQNLDQAQRLIERNIPIAISYSWDNTNKNNDGTDHVELPGAPLEHSDGHLAVLRGFTANGDCAINDPAHPALRIAYPRTAIENLWQNSGGVAYVVAPVGIEFLDILATF